MTSSFLASEPTDVAVTLLSGFLGSGKTTLLNGLLRAPDMADAAIIINEFGSIPLDQHFVNRLDDDVAVLANGCLCCFARDGLEDALLRLTSMQRKDRGPLSRILIETSGLADPGPIIQVVFDLPTPAGRLALNRVIVTVDSQHIPGQLDRYEESRRQIAFADLLVFTKADRLDSATIAAARRHTTQFNRTAPHMLGGGGDLLGDILPSVTDEFSGVGHRVDADGHTRMVPHTSSITTCSIVEETPIEWAAFSRWFRRLRREHGENILRMKGVLRVVGVDVPVAVDAVHHIAYPARRMPNLAMPRGSRLVFIVQNLPPAHIRDAWALFIAARHSSEVLV